jgi:hypothetical protein
MAKISGLGGVVSVADAGSVARVITNDVTNYSFTTPRGVQDTTGVDKSAHEALLLLADFTVSLAGVFNSAANMSHAVLSTVPSTSVIRATNLQVTNSGGTPQITCNTFYTDYSVTRSNAGDLTWTAPGQLGDGAVPTWA